jgi:hypothetical protein
MSIIPATQRKLRDAHATFRLLQASARAIPLNHEECDRHLGAFLSAAYSVEDVLKTESGKPHKGWVKDWWSKRSIEDQELHACMREQRNDELHRRGAAVNTEPQEISAWDYLRRTEWMRSGGGNGRSFFWGPVGWGISSSMTITILLLGGEEVTERCARYLNLLEQMVQAFLAAHPTP